MSSSLIPIATIGAGRWGSLHARKLARLPGVVMHQIVDSNIARARALAATIPGARAVASVDDLSASVQAVTVATPARTLARVAGACLDRGLHVLCEKPLATSSGEARQLLGLAHARGRRLHVGMVERFNPRLQGWPHFDHHLALYRWGPARCAPCGLGLDWAIHDLDLARWLARTDLRVLSAEGGGDTLLVELATVDGRTVTVDVRSGAERHRREAQLDGVQLDLWRPGGDALADELASFVQSVAGGSGGRLATIEDAVQALELLETARSRLSVAA